MATVTLDRLFLQSAADAADAINCFTAPGTQDVQSLPVEVRTMANGRVRTVARAGSSRQVNVTLRGLSAADISWLVGHRGSLVLLRDSRGRKVYGVYSSVNPQEYRDRSGSDVELALTEVSHSEVV